MHSIHALLCLAVVLETFLALTVFDAGAILADVVWINPEEYGYPDHLCLLCIVIVCKKPKQNKTVDVKYIEERHFRRYGIWDRIPIMIV